MQKQYILSLFLLLPTSTWGAHSLFSRAIARADRVASHPGMGILAFVGSLHLSLYIVYCYDEASFSRNPELRHLRESQEREDILQQKLQAELDGLAKRYYKKREFEIDRQIAQHALGKRTLEQELEKAEEEKSISPCQTSKRCCYAD